GALDRAHIEIAVNCGKPLPIPVLAARRVTIQAQHPPVSRIIPVPHKRNVRRITTEPNGPISMFFRPTAVPRGGPLQAGVPIEHQPAPTIELSKVSWAREIEQLASKRHTLLCFP